MCMFVYTYIYVYMCVQTCIYTHIHVHDVYASTHKTWEFQKKAQPSGLKQSHGRALSITSSRKVLQGPGLSVTQRVLTQRVLVLKI